MIGGVGNLGNTGNPSAGGHDWITNRAAFDSHYDAFMKSMDELQKAQEDAENAVSALNSWVELGTKAMSVVTPILDAEMKKKAAEAAKPKLTPADKLGNALTQFTAINEKLQPFIAMLQKPGVAPKPGV